MCLLDRPTFRELDRRLAIVDESIVTQAQGQAIGLKQSDTLLEQVFPKHVADALRAGKKVRDTPPLLSSQLLTGSRW